MYKGILSNLLYTLIIGLIITACNSSSNKKTATTSGRVIDDYISGATVCADVNKNKLADDGIENCIETDGQGGYKFSTHRTESLVVVGGIDIGTGKRFKGTFLAPPESNVITPLTTLVVSVQEEGNKSVEEAQNIVKESLGLADTTLNLSTFDPLKELQFGKDTTTREVAQQVLAQQTNIQIILTVTATTIATASKDVEEKHVTVEASNQIAQLILNNPTEESSIQINSKASIETIIEETALETFNQDNNDHKEALASIENIQTVVAQQIEETTKSIVTAIKTLPVDTEESGLDAINASNIGILLVTDTQEGSIKHTIENAIATKDPALLESIDIKDTIENIKDEIIERPPVDDRNEDDTDIIPTGAEGGSL
jgi:hypothetical protein